MSRTATRRAVTVAFLLLGVGACSTSAPPTLYTIAPVPGEIHGGGPRVVLLQQIGLARYLERQQIVRSSENYRLDVMSNDWWGEPLAAMLSRVLVDELGQRLPGSTVLSESGAVTSTADATVELNIQRLDKDASGRLVLQAQAGVTRKGRETPSLQSFRFEVPTSGKDTAGDVAATSKAVGLLADGLAAMLVTGPKPK